METVLDNNVSFTGSCAIGMPREGFEKKKEHALRVPRRKKTCSREKKTMFSDH